MVGNLMATAAMATTGWCVWLRRRSWPIPWEAALTLSIALQGLGFVFCIPMDHYVGRALWGLTHIAHLRDYFGHLLFLAGACAMIYALAMRALPDERLDGYMKRYEIPGAVGAGVLLVCITNSPTLKHVVPYDDFFAVPCDGWLKMYWVTYGIVVAYILVTLIQLLLVLRTDRRAKSHAVDMLIVAAAIGIVTVCAHAAGALVPSLGITPAEIWVGICVPSGIAAAAGMLSWRARSCHRLARLMIRRLEAPRTDESP